MDILLTGSVAYDYLMTFPGQFKEQILPERLSSISLSFLVDSMSKQRGGVAPNIAYTMALLGQRPRVMATVGEDFEEFVLSVLAARVVQGPPVGARLLDLLPGRPVVEEPVLLVVVEDPPSRLRVRHRRVDPIRGRQDVVRRERRRAIPRLRGDAKIVEVRLVLREEGQRVALVGESGSGARLKLVVNLVLGLNRAALAEGLALAESCGIEPAAALNVLKATPAYSAVMDTKGPKMVAREFAPQARLSQHLIQPQAF